MSTGPQIYQNFSNAPYPQTSRRENAPADSIPHNDNSIWAAALRAAGCTAKSAGQSIEIQWQAGEGCLRYTATERVMIEPFGVVLGPGESLEVGWAPGETSYTLGVYGRRAAA
jgi:hypothetical protein